MVVVTYDVTVVTPEGRKRLRQVARVCSNFGQRVQNSVFQCLVDQGQWVLLRAALLDILDSEEDSLRFYYLGRNWKKRIEQHGGTSMQDLDEPLIT